MSYSPFAQGITASGQSQAGKFMATNESGDFEFQDNDKLIFGADADASIYSDNSSLLIANQASYPVTIGHADATVTIPGNLTVTGTTTTVDTVTMNAANAIVFEGATANDFETTLTIVDPTADRTWTLPDVTDTVVGLVAAQTLTNKTLTSPDINGGTWNGTIDAGWTAAGVTCADLGTVTTADINGGTIDGANITVGSSKTLDVSGGTLTLAADQISGDKVEGGTIAATTITALTTAGITATANIDIGTFSLTANTLVSDVANGTSPLTVTSTTKVANLNADLLDGMTTIDEDGMDSDSATALPTQQSVKAYVDANSSATSVDTSFSDGDTVGSNVNLVNAAAGSLTLKVPENSSAGTKFTIKKTDASTNTVTVSQTTADTIDGSATKILYFQYESITVISDGSNWHIM
jgi:hypothetical protein